MTLCYFGASPHPPIMIFLCILQHCWSCWPEPPLIYGRPHGYRIEYFIITFQTWDIVNVDISMQYLFSHISCSVVDAWKYAIQCYTYAIKNIENMLYIYHQLYKNKENYWLFSRIFDCKYLWLQRVGAQKFNNAEISTFTLCIQEIQVVYVS